MSTGARPTATVTIEPIGKRASIDRDHAIKIVIDLNTREARYADKGYVASVLKKVLEGFPPAQGQTDRRKIGEVSVDGRATKTKPAVATVVGVEGSAVWFERPHDQAVERLRDGLQDEGYRVTLRGKRECGEPACMSEATIDWDKTADVPAGWYSTVICGRHNYRTCGKCQSVYVLTCESAAGQAPSVQCSVCGTVIIEWGSSKIWSAELIRRGEAQA